MDTRARVLIIDDDPVLTELVTKILTENTFEVYSAAKGSDGLRLAEELSPAVILLDIRMPEIDGLTICDQLRSHDDTRMIPVIMLTGVTDPEHRIRAFKYGADDYLIKPFRSEELISRVESKLRRIKDFEDHPRKEDLLKCGNLVLNQHTLQVTIAGREITLRGLEYRLLKHFITHKGKLQTRKQLTDAIWGKSAASDRVLDPHISALRKKLKGFDHVFSTVYRQGYLLKGPVKAKS